MQTLELQVKNERLAQEARERKDAEVNLITARKAEIRLARSSGAGLSKCKALPVRGC